MQGLYGSLYGSFYGNESVELGLNSARNTSRNFPELEFSTFASSLARGNLLQWLEPLSGIPQMPRFDTMCSGKDEDA